MRCHYRDDHTLQGQGVTAGMTKLTELFRGLPVLNVLSFEASTAAFRVLEDCVGQQEELLPLLSTAENITQDIAEVNTT